MSFSIDDAWDNCGPVARAGNAAFGVYCRCGAWAARNLTDGIIPTEVALAYGSPELASKLVSAGLWEAVDGGWSMPAYLERNPAAAVVRRRRVQATKRQALVRDPALRHAIRVRDQDRCRYCAVAVKWTDRKGPLGGTYDHVDPDGPNSFDNLVVSCRSCNSMKQDRTPEAAGLVLRAPPTGNLGATRVSSRSGSRSHLDSSRPFTPPKGGTDARTSAALPPPHPFDDIGGSCKCGLPRTNKIHPAA